MKGVEVDGHVLSLKFSTKPLSQPKSNKRKRTEGDVDTAPTGTLYYHTYL